MSDKRYPTRMHEVLGVEPGEPFKIIGSQCIDDFCISIEGRLQHADNPGLACCRSDLEYAINNGITRRPRLTEEQEAQLKALDTLGFKWLAKDENDEVAAFKGRPDKGRGQWQDGGEYIVLYPFMPTNCLMDLPDWSDPAPLDIVQVLREKGVEVEVE